MSRSDVVNAFSEAGLDLLSVVGSMIGGAIKSNEQLQKQEAHIKELKEAQRQLQLAQQDLVRSQQLAVLGRMASSINHEIGNLLMPLLSIIPISRKKMKMISKCLLLKNLPTAARRSRV